ncbi:MAG TPA: polysaccharide biosynthesis C-terminal domain-containing protein, partial [Bacteroidales bacterium]|nr:polysaccharide biosynthesis C-terminal domain-containing protein [Bacteroidales bacterium]
LLRTMLAYAFPMLIVGLAGMVNEVSDKILLKYLLPDPATAMAELGVYGANYKLAVLMTLFIQMFRYAAEPFFFAQAKEDNAREVYALVMKYFVVFGLLIFLGVMLFLDLVKYFIGPDFRGGLHIVPVVLLANLFLGIFYNLAIWFKLTDRTWYGAILALGGALVTVVVLFSLVPVMGYAGAAWAHFACYGSMMVMSYLWGQKHYRVPYDLKTMGLYTLLALAIFGISQWIKMPGMALSLGLNTLLLVGFAGVVWVKEKANHIKDA